MTTQEQLHRLEHDYLPAFLGYAINRLQNIDAAEELAQEIAYRSLVAIRSGRVGEQVDYDTYLWSIARNAYVDQIRRRSRAPLGETAMLGLCTDEPTPEETVIADEEQAEIRLALSRLWGNYRRVLVCRYYEDLPIAAIAERLGISAEMVKFYLRAGKEKLKEGLTMIGKSSFSPKPFSVYRMGGWSTVNVWQLLARKLPAQLTILCHDASRTVTELAAETGTPAVYLEDELNILVNAGLVLPVGRDRYRTNFHILKADTMDEVEATFRQLYAAYIPHVIEAFNRHLPALRETDAFDHPVDDERYRFLWAKMTKYSIGDGKKHDFPRILSDGCPAYVYAVERDRHRWGFGESHHSFDGAEVIPVDFSASGRFHFQDELNDETAARHLCNIVLGKSDGSDDPLLTSRLVDQGFLVHVDGRLCSNVMHITPTVRTLFKAVNAELAPTLTELFGDRAERIRTIVRATIPEQLRDYADGFAAQWSGMFARLYFYEALENADFLHVPRDERLPIGSYILVK